MILECGTAGDLNGWVGDIDIDGVIGKFGMSGVNEWGEELIEMCGELGLLIGNTCLKNAQNTQVYMGKTSAWGGVSDRTLMDYVIIKKDLWGG